MLASEPEVRRETVEMTIVHGSGRRNARLFDRSVIALLVGAAAVITGVVSGLLPFARGSIEACALTISPPAEFTIRHAESVTSTGGHVSWFPFGAQCTYATSQATEVAVSVVPLWPSIAIVLGAALMTLAVAGALRAWRVPR